MKAKLILAHLGIAIILSMVVRMHIEILWNEIPRLYLVFPLLSAFMLGMQVMIITTTSKE